jgi:4-nitrophenyl phosphatase
MIKAVLLDLDGTLFIGKSAIPGAERALEALRARGIRVFFLTNASTRTRKGTVEKLKGMGIIAHYSEIFGSSFMVADYIATRHPEKTVYCLSERGMHEELAEKGVKTVEDDSADIVAVGLDRQLTYGKLSIAFRAIMKGAVFIASNDDATFPVEDGFLPGSGALVAAVQYSTGKKPIVLGKPNRYGVDLLLRTFRLRKSEVIIVGDRLETDILTGRRIGVKTVLVLTGVSKKKNIRKLKRDERPDYVIKSVALLPGLLSRLG